MFRKGILAVVAVSLLSGCIGGAQKVSYLKDKADIPNFVAVLPPANNSTDLAAPDTTRRVACEMMLALGVIPFTSPSQEEQLKKMGITDGGQLNAYKAPDIAAKLGVDGLLYSVIKNFNEINVGVYINRSVEAEFTLVDKMGEKIWQIEGTGFNRAVNVTPGAILQEGAKAMAQQLVGKQLEKMLKIHLLQEAQKMTGLMIPKLPQWPVNEKGAADASMDDSGGRSKLGGALMKKRSK